MYHTISFLNISQMFSFLSLITFMDTYCLYSVIKSSLEEYPFILKSLEFILYVEFYGPRFQMFRPKYSRSDNFASTEPF